MTDLAFFYVLNFKKVIIVVSQHEAEHSTVLVIDWLHFLKADYRKINGINALCDINYTISSIGSTVNYQADNKKVEADVVWYRRWTPQDYFIENADITDSATLNIQFRDYYKDENRILAKYFLAELNGGYLLSDFSRISINKLGVLKYAAGVGLSIPHTLVTASKSALEDFMNTNRDIIIKNISEVGMFSHKERIFVSYTTGFSRSDLNRVPGIFFPTIFQAKVEKRYELRVFYLDGKCFSMAIFSQENEQTKTDFRIYDFENPNRNVPYDLPVSEEDKIDRLMKKLGLNCGSVDLIRAVTGEYVFLEINPVGQFGMVSEPCNYFLEKKIAEHLIDHDKKAKYASRN